MKAIKRILLVSIGVTLLTTSVQAQDAAPRPHPRPAPKDNGLGSLKDRIYYGGNVGLNFSQYGYYLELSPIVGYKLTPKFSAGVLATYQHYDYKIGSWEFKDEIYGAGVFGRYLIGERFFAHAEAKFLNGTWLDNERSNIYPVLVGGGYRGRMGENASVYIMLLYDINHDYVKDPNSSPLIETFGFGIGF